MDSMCYSADSACLQSDVGQIGRLIQKGEAKLKEYQHPDPYIGVPIHIQLISGHDLAWGTPSTGPCMQKPQRALCNLQSPTILAAPCTLGIRPSLKSCISSWILEGRTTSCIACGGRKLQGM